MAQYTIDAVLCARRDTTANWNAAIGFIPRNGEIIVYTDYKTKEIDGQIVNVPGIKIGTGNAYVQDLVFIGTSESEIADLLAHIEDTNAHITAAERTFWNNKLSIDDENEVVEETLQLTRN